MNKTIEKKVKIPWEVLNFKIPISEKITKKTKEVLGEYVRDSYGRIAKYQTTEEYETRRQRILSTPLL